MKAPQNGVPTLCFEQNKVQQISKRTKHILNKTREKAKAFVNVPTKINYFSTAK